MVVDNPDLDDEQIINQQPVNFNTNIAPAQPAKPVTENELHDNPSLLSEDSDSKKQVSNSVVQTNANNNVNRQYESSANLVNQPDTNMQIPKPKLKVSDKLQNFLSGQPEDHMTIVHVTPAEN